MSYQTGGTILLFLRSEQTYYVAQQDQRFTTPVSAVPSGYNKARNNGIIYILYDLANKDAYISVTATENVAIKC
jgi:hypothetical protein